MHDFHFLLKSEDWSKPQKDYTAQFIIIIISSCKEITWGFFVWFFTTKQFHRLFGGKSRIDERGGRFYSFFNWLHVKDVQMRWRTNTTIWGRERTFQMQKWRKEYRVQIMEKKKQTEMTEYENL